MGMQFLQNLDYGLLVRCGLGLSQFYISSEGNWATLEKAIDQLEKILVYLPDHR